MGSESSSHRLIGNIFISHFFITKLKNHPAHTPFRTHFNTWFTGQIFYFESRGRKRLVPLADLTVAAGR